MYNNASQKIKAGPLRWNVTIKLYGLQITLYTTIFLKQWLVIIEV